MSHRIVIVGGGAGGLELATRLGRTLGKKGLARIVLADANLTHIWKPLLHEVAAGSLNSTENELNYVVDGAAVPSPVGVNPQVTIMAMALRAGALLDRRLS